MPPHSRRLIKNEKYKAIMYFIILHHTIMNVMDPLWLSTSVIDNLSVLYENHIHKINCEYDILNPNKAHYFKTQNFIEALYLQLMYLQGHLWLFPFGKRLSTKYLSANQHILIELCKRGVFTVRETDAPSSYEFMVLIHDEAAHAFVEMLFEMSSLDDMNIVAKRMKCLNVLCEHAYGKDVKKISFADPSKILTKEMIFPNHSVYHVVVSSNEHMVEDIVLYYWLSFNSTYHSINM